MELNLITATHVDFEPLVGETFQVEAHGFKVDLTLDNIKLAEHLLPRDNHLEIDGVVYPPRQTFALTFEGPREPILDTQTYVFSNAKIGNIEIFISPFRQDHACMLYESVFS